MPKKTPDRLLDEYSLFGELKTAHTEISKIARHITQTQRDLHRLERNKLHHGKSPLSLKNGYTLVPNELITAPDLTDGEKMTMINLLRYCYRKKIAWPSEKRQAAERGISTRQLQRHLTNLVRRGYLWIQLIVHQGTRYHNRYHLNIEDPHRHV